jgi:hypothetical protein
VISSGDQEHPRRKVDVSRRGGPGTLGGTDFQLRVSVLNALNLIGRQLLAPHHELQFALEGVRGR